jgi:transposase
MNCIGIDVGKQTLVTYDGQKERSFPNSEGLTELASFLRKKGQGVIVVFEPTSTYSRGLEALCRKKGIRCCYLNPRVIPHLREVAGGRSKTDQSDAELLYQYGQERAEAEAQVLQQDSLGSALATRLSCHRVVQKARVTFQGVLEALSHDPDTPSELLGELKERINRLKSWEEQELSRAEEYIREDKQASSALDRLLSIPGIGLVSAIRLIGLFRRYPHTNRKQVVALVGLDPVERQSGSSVRGKPRISKRGSAELRRLLYEVTLPAARYNPQIKAVYQRLKARGKAEKVARIAAARKLLLMAHAIYKSGGFYRAPKGVTT